jgi:hypothetical protein
MASTMIRIAAVAGSVVLAAGFVIYRTGGIRLLAAEGGGTPVTAGGTQGNAAVPATGAATEPTARERVLMSSSKSAIIVPSSGSSAPGTTQPGTWPANGPFSRDAVEKAIGGKDRVLLPGSKSWQVSPNK